MSNPTVSVVIPSYNHEKYVKETIDSILNQTFQDFEIVITDDGSSDATVDRIKEYTDPRIRLFMFENNKGHCKTLNHCIKNSKGKYIAYMSSDDIWELEKLEKQVNYLKTNPDVQAVFSKVRIIDEEGNQFQNKEHFFYSIFDQENKLHHEWLRHFFYEGNSLCHPSVLLRREVYDAVGLYNERVSLNPDFDMWIKLCLNQFKIHILDDKLIKFRVRDYDLNVSGDTPSNNIKARFEYKQLLDNFLKIDEPEFLLKIFPESEKYGKVSNETIPYFLGRLAYDSQLDFKQLWGLELIYECLGDKKTSRILEVDYNFTTKDLNDMSSHADVFNLFRDKQLLNEIYQLRDVVEMKDNEIIRLTDILILRDKEIKRLNNLIKNEPDKKRNRITELFR